MGNYFWKEETMSSVIINSSSKHTASIIFLHGLGDTCHGWSQAFKAIRQPHVRYVFPTANSIPVTLNGGMKMPAWFDILGLHPGCTEDESGINSSSEYLQSLIHDEEKLGIARNRIVIGGFSQGGAVAFHSAFTIKQNALAGVIGLSTWMPMHKAVLTSAKANCETPILQCHGLEDPLIPHMMGEMSSELIKKFNSNVIFKSYHGMQHSSNDQEMEDVKEFINQCLPAI